MAYTIIVSAARPRIEPVRRRSLLRTWLFTSDEPIQVLPSKPGTGAGTLSVAYTLLHTHEILMLSPWTGDYETALINRVLPKRVSGGLQPSRSHFLSLSSPRLDRYRYECESTAGTAIRTVMQLSDPFARR